MKLTSNIILFVLISIVVSSAVFFGIQAFDLDRQKLEIQVAALQNKILNLESMVKALSKDSDNIKDDKMKNYLDESEKKLKLGTETDFNALEARLNALESVKNAEKTDEPTKKLHNDENLEDVVGDKIKQYFDDLKAAKLKENREKEFNKIYNKFKQDLSKLKGKNAATDEEIEKILGIGADYLNLMLDLKAEYGYTDGNSLTDAQKQEYNAKMIELSRDKFYNEIRSSIGDDSFMSIRTSSRRDEDMIKINNAIKKYNLEDWQREKVAEALNRHYEQTRYIDMVLKTETLTDENINDYNIQINDSWKAFNKEIYDQVLTEEQRKSAMNSR